MGRHAPKTAPGGDLFAQTRSYYHPGQSPRSRLHKHGRASEVYTRKQEGSRASFVILEKAEAKRRRRAQKRKAVQP